MKKFSNFISEAGQPEIPNEPTYGRNPSNGYLTDEVVKKLNAVVGRISLKIKSIQRESLLYVVVR